MMQPAREPAYPTGSEDGTALDHFSPGGEAHCLLQAQPGDSPGQRVQAAKVLIGGFGNEELQRLHKLLMHVGGFGHAGTSMNRDVREHAWVSFFRAFLPFSKAHKICQPTSCLSWILCQRLGFLKRGNPTPGILFSFAARKRLRALESRSESICTQEAGTASPPLPLKATFKLYLEGKVPSCSYCCFTTASMSL